MTFWQSIVHYWNTEVIGNGPIDPLNIAGLAFIILFALGVSYFGTKHIDKENS